MNKNFEFVKLGSICDFQNGFAFKSKYFKTSGMPIIRISNIQNERISFKNIVFTDTSIYKEDLSRYHVNPGDLLIAMSGGTTGKIGFNNTNNVFLLNQRVGKFEPSDKLNKQFLYYFLSTKIEENLRISAGAAIPNLSTSQINNFQIPLPPLPEQKRIVSILNKAFAAIDKAIANTEKNLQNTKELFDSYLNEIFSNPGDDWEKKLLEEVCLVERGSSPRPIKNYLTTEENGVNWIKIGDTKGVTKYIYKSNQKITIQGSKKSRYVNVGDFILSNSMSFGKPYIMKTDGYIHDGWFVLRLKESINSEYFYYLLSSPYVQNQFQTLASGAIVKNINSDLTKSALLHIAPINEQNKIVSKIELFEKNHSNLIIVYQQKLDNLKELKQSILQKAFEGEL